MSSTLVPAVGSLSSKIVLIGEAPGREEELRGEPFVGGSGHLLNSMLGNAGILRRECYITNVCKSRPENNDFALFYDDPHRRNHPSRFLLDSIGELHNELRRLKPNVIIPLGAEALRAISGLRSIYNWRGSILSSDFGKLVSTYHPAAILRNYPLRPVAELDLKRAGKQAQFPDLRLPPTKFILKPSLSDVKASLDACRRSGRVALDIETTGPHVRCLGLSWDKGTAICIPFIISQRIEGSLFEGSRLYLDRVSNTPGSYWTEYDELEILHLLDSLFQDPTIQFIGQNFIFDSSVLALDFGISPKEWFLDTMVAQHACYAELPVGLDFIGSIYTEYPYWSDYDASSDEQTWKYNCYDAVVTYEVSFDLEKELADFNLTEFYHSHLHPVVPALSQTQHRGVKINRELRDRKRSDIERDLECLKARLRGIAEVPDFNPRSWKQKANLLYVKLDLPQVMHHKRHTLTTDKNALDKLSRRYPQYSAVFEALKEYNEKATLLSSFLSSELGEDGKIRTSFNPCGTVTGRLSSSKPILYPGMDLQNIPIRTESGKDFRRMFEADSPDWSLIKADLSQAEFRIIVWGARIRWLIEEYTNPHSTFDVHKWLATKIFNKPAEQIAKEERAIAKNGIFGGQYKMFYKTAAVTYKISEERARYVLDTHRAAFPELIQWWLSIDQEVSSVHMLTSPLGRKRLFLDRTQGAGADDTFRQAYSHFAQCVVGDIINRALALSVDTFDERECHPILQVHDELVYHCRRDLVPLYARRIRNLMEYPIRFPGVSVPLIIPAEISFGPNWLDQTKIEKA